MFSVAPLNWEEWKVVLYLSAPILVLEEVLKFVSVGIVIHAFIYLAADDFRQVTFVNPPARKLKID